MDEVRLNWHPADSADRDHEDEECDLIGYAGEASWAYVALNGGRWSWGVLDNWLWDEADYLAQGECELKEEAKVAVLAWVQREEEASASTSERPRRHRSVLRRWRQQSSTP